MYVNKILNGNSLDVLKTLPDAFIDCTITSPPYWGLRDYGHEEQLGSEDNCDNYVANLCNIFDEVKRVLKPEGTCWINLGDTYGGICSRASNNGRAGFGTEREGVYGRGIEKCLMMIPARFGIEMIKRGWILRNKIIWHKPNAMPSSVTDRFTVDYEEIFFFVKSKNYYFEQQREDNKTEYTESWGDFKRKKVVGAMADLPMEKEKFDNYRTNGRNVRTTWSINTEPCADKHFATYPQTLMEFPLKAGCPENGLVLDPFFGSGTTGIYARKANRNYLGIELNPDYIKIAENRLYKELGMFL